MMYGKINSPDRTGAIFQPRRCTPRRDARWTKACGYVSFNHTIRSEAVFIPTKLASRLPGLPKEGAMSNKVLSHSPVFALGSAYGLLISRDPHAALIGFIVLAIVAIIGSFSP
jgi:hypothetical protein